jgi:hypothetical protein
VSAISGVVNSVLSDLLVLFAATVVDVSIMILLEGTILELCNIVFILCVPTVIVVLFILGTAALVVVIFSMSKVVSESVLLVLRGAELNIVFEFSVVVAILLNIIALVIAAVLLKLLRAEIVLPFMIIEPFSVFSEFVIVCEMLVL